MPFHWFCFAAERSANSTATEKRNDTDTGLKSSFGDGDHITSIEIVVPLSSSASSFCNFILLSSLNTPSTFAAAAVAVSRQSPTLICVASETDIIFYSVPDLNQVLAFPAAGWSSGAVKSVVFSLDDSRIFTAHQDCRIRVWSASISKFDGDNRHVRRLIATLPTKSDFLRHFALPSNYVVVRRHKRALWVKHVDVVSSLAVTDNLLYSASWDKTVKIWNPNSNFRCLHTLTAHDDAINVIAVAPDGTVYTVSSDKTIKVWKNPPSKSPQQRNWRNSTTKKKNKNQGKLALIATLEKHTSTVNALVLSSDGSLLYSGGNDRSIVVWERRESTNPHMVAATTLSGHEKAVMCLATVDDLVISGSSDLTVRIWQRGEEEYQRVAVLNGHRKVIRSLTACRFTGGSGTTEYCLCSGSVDGEVRVWKVMA